MSQPGYYPTRYPVPAQRLPQQVRPSLWWVGAGVAVILAGIIGAMVVAFTGLTGMDDRVVSFQRVPVPGVGDLHLAAGRDYTGYYEYTGASESNPLQQAVVTLTDPIGKPVELHTYETNLSYQVNSHEGRATFTFHADKDGTYRLTTIGSDRVTVAVGSGIGSSLAWSVLMPFAFVAGGLILGLAIVVTVVALRDRDRKRAATTPPGPGGR
ncbi:hypothetical protein [Nocardia yamanashiensis]|uniref:hypothetical protein n=1 Tax=Nocardia yamanashiensis TaxID=209247 RepID=UPI000B2815EA|nr:hypothetical protein [Nocardia yamanashiensis]